MHTRRAAAIAAMLFSVSPAAAGDWTGFYIGGGIGADAATTDISASDPANSGDFFAVDNFGGGDLGATIKAGADWQLNQWLVVGAFANYDWSTVETKASLELSTIDAELNADAKLLDLQRSWAIGGRIGLVVSPTTLAYGLIGYTRAKLSDLSLSATQSEFDPFTGETFSESNSASVKLPEFDGIVFGGGFEHRISSNLSLWGEYRQSRFGAASVQLGDSENSVSFDPTIHIGRVGVAYRFGGAAEAATLDAAPPRRWTGFYGGVGLGVDGIEGEAALAAQTADAIVEANGEGVGGGDIGGTALAGYDLQSGSLVGGVYVAYDRSAHDVSISAASEGEELRFDIPSIGNVWTIAARAGYLVTPDTLAYVLAGYTRLEFSDWEASFRDTAVSASAPKFNGFTLGLGFEKLVTDNLSLRAEYRYSGFGEKTFDATVDDDSGNLPTVVSTSIDPTVHSVRLLAAYRFNTP